MMMMAMVAVMVMMIKTVVVMTVMMVKKMIMTVITVMGRMVMVALASLTMATDLQPPSSPHRSTSPSVSERT